ncbi:hypothetical protein NQ317_014821 [Molorchus minor]|uniref:DNA/RNA non-specific endonuclease/pyrophosphatase/phosphodiesterase domain-containing protein n=1 Tax=Molorchus minor TaxID=1323400 RepID=A0ABQ9IWK3_9CUCU|nr:hypothetical protein NQ317_014821 [Molorchus minor]
MFFQNRMVLFVVSAILIIIPKTVLTDCVISTNGDLGEPQPLIVNLNYTIRHPQSSDTVTFYTNESFILSCPGTHLQIGVGSQKLNFSEHETAKNSATIFSNITCLEYPIQIARSTNQTCEDGNQEIEIGFFGLLRLHQTFNNLLQQQNSRYPLFTFATDTLHPREAIRPSWINDDFYNFGGNISNKDANALLYSGNQIALLSSLTGYNSSTSNPYINYTADLYLARGHLTAKADFVYGAQQRLTFHMVNAAPQWQTFNGRNWAYAEANARDLASNYNLTLEIYTGTYGVMTLPHLQTHQDVEIYMYNDSQGNKEFPVPLLFWKYMYEPITQSGIVLVGINDPYITNVSKAIVCNDIYSSINWTTTFTRNDTLNGYMYACAPDDFRKTVTYMPNLPLKYLLTLNSTYNSTSNSSFGTSSSVTICCTFWSIFVALILFICNNFLNKMC